MIICRQCTNWKWWWQFTNDKWPHHFQIGKTVLIFFALYIISYCTFQTMCLIRFQLFVLHNMRPQDYVLYHEAYQKLVTILLRVYIGSNFPSLELLPYHWLPTIPFPFSTFSSLCLHLHSTFLWNIPLSLFLLFLLQYSFFCHFQPPFAQRGRDLLWWPNLTCPSVRVQKGWAMKSSSSLIIPVSIPTRKASLEFPRSKASGSLYKTFLKALAKRF